MKMCIFSFYDKAIVTLEYSTNKEKAKTSEVFNPNLRATFRKVTLNKKPSLGAIHKVRPDGRGGSKQKRTSIVLVTSFLC